MRMRGRNEKTPPEKQRTLRGSISRAGRGQGWRSLIPGTEQESWTQDDGESLLTYRPHILTRSLSCLIQLLRLFPLAVCSHLRPSDPNLPAPLSHLHSVLLLGPKQALSIPAHRLPCPRPTSFKDQSLYSPSACCPPQQVLLSTCDLSDFL